MIDRIENSSTTLTRAPGQTVKIGDDIYLIVVGIEGSRVILGIDAPRDQRILRGELEDIPETPIVIDTAGHPPERIPPR